MTSLMASLTKIPLVTLLIWRVKNDCLNKYGKSLDRPFVLVRLLMIKVQRSIYFFLTGRRTVIDASVNIGDDAAWRLEGKIYL